jgi:hypothetical protein
VAHACNPTYYSGGRHQEDCRSKPVQAIIHKILSWKNPSQNRVGRVAQGVDPEFKHQYRKKKGRKEGRKEGGREGGRKEGREKKEKISHHNFEN